MSYKFNPFTGNFDSVGQPISALNVKGSVADVASLPLGATVGDVYLVQADSHFYVWDGAAWDDLGTLQGATGSTGADGKTILNGSGAPSAGLGVDGDFYLDTAATEIYGPKTAGAWGSPTSLIGPTGTTGPAGADGADGVGVVAGGTTGQALVKASNTDYDTQWSDVTAVAAINDLTDVVITTPSDGQVLEYDSATSQWINATPTGGGGGGTPGGSDTQIQFNDAGSFGGDVDLTWNKTTNVMTVAGDVNLSDGGTYTTTLQTITPTAARTISFPDATGTVALVGGSNGQLVYNNAGAYAGASGSSVGASGDITLSANGAASTPSVSLTGTWFSGGTGTTTTPQLLIDGSATPSTTWNTSGTGLGVNAASTFNGNLLDLQKDGTSKLRVGSAGSLHLPGDGTTLTSANWTGINGSNLTTTNNGVAIRSNSCFLGSNVLFGWGSTTDPINSQDLSLARDAAHTLAQRNGTNAQTYRLYNTYTDASNYERAKLSWNSNVFEIGTEGAGTGLGRALTLQTSGTDRVTLGAGTGLTVHGSVSQAFIDCTAYFASTTANGSRALAGNGFAVGSAFTYSFSSTTGANGTPDVALKRDQAGVVAVTNGSTGLGTLQAQLRAQGTAPASATATGTAGDIRYDADYIYVCTATNTWKRAALATW